MEFELTGKEKRARQRVCFALDVDEPSDAISLVRELSDVVGMYKVGMELHTKAASRGSPILGDIHRISGTKFPNIFLDLKFEDTPATVYGAAKAAASSSGLYMFNIHIAGGETMCKKAIEGAHDGAKGRSQPPKVIGVTVLTSLDDNDLKAQGYDISFDDLVKIRAERAREWGLDGIVCPASKAGGLEKEFGSDFIYVTPSIDWGGLHGTGQKQLYTPDKAVQDCSRSILVIGSAIRKAENRRETAYEILQAMAPHV